MRDVELKYNITEKQAYALVRALKSYRVYILHSKIVAPTKLVKGQGLAKLLTKGNYKVLGVNVGLPNLTWEESQNEGKDLQVHERYLLSPWYKDIVYFLLTLQCPLGMEKSKMRYFKLKAMKYYILNWSLYWKDHGGILLNCVDEDESHRIMSEMHRGACGGHHY